MSEKEPKPERPPSTHYSTKEIEGVEEKEVLETRSHKPKKRSSQKQTTSNTTSPQSLPDPLPIIKEEGPCESRFGKLGKVGAIQETYFRLQDNLLYIYRDQKSKHPNKVINLCDADNVQATEPLLTMNMKDGNSHSFRAKNRADFRKWEQTLSNAIKLANNTDNPRKIVDVYFLDGSKIGCIINRKNTTAEDLWWCVCDALQLPEDVRECFFVWIHSGSFAYLLCNTDIVFEVLQNWPSIDKKYSKTGLEGPPRIVFRTTPILDLKTERNIKNNKAIHLFYVQALHHLTQGNYPIATKTAIELAGLQAQIHFGDYDPAKKGYISKALPKFIPREILKRNKKKEVEWVNLISAEHRKHKGKELLICELLYLQQLRTLPFYGCTFFTGKNRDRNADSGYFSQVDEGQLTIGINMEGLHTFNKYKYMQSFAWKDITHWEVEKDRYFYFTTSVLDSSGFYAKYLLETKEAPLMLELINDIIFELKRQQRIVQTVRRQQSKFLQTLRSAPALGSAMSDVVSSKMAKDKKDKKDKKKKKE